MWGPPISVQLSSIPSFYAWLLPSLVHCVCWLAQTSVISFACLDVLHELYNIVMVTKLGKAHDPRDRYLLLLNYLAMKQK